MPSQPTSRRQSAGKAGNQSRSRRPGKAGNQADESQAPEADEAEPTPAIKPATAAGEAAASGPASSAADSRFGLGNPGSFEPRESQPTADDGGFADAAIPAIVAPDWWTPERAEKVLKGQGALTHALIGVGEQDWQWQPGELDAVAPPMADAFNRVDVLRRFAPYADAIGAIGGVAAYFERSRRERGRVLATLVPVEAPTTGVDAGGVAWQRPDEPAPAPPSAEQTERRQNALRDVLSRGRRNEQPSEETIEWRSPE